MSFVNHVLGLSCLVFACLGFVSLVSAMVLIVMEMERTFVANMEVSFLLSQICQFVLINAKLVIIVCINNMVSIGT